MSLQSLVLYNFLSQVSYIRCSMDILNEQGYLVRPNEDDLELSTQTIPTEYSSRGAYMRYLTRRHKWYDHQLQATTNKYKQQKIRMIRSQQWQQQQFFIAQVFDRSDNVRYSSTASKLAANPGVREKKHGKRSLDPRAHSPSHTKTQSISILRSGLFTATPHNVLRHEAMASQLNEKEHVRSYSSKLPTLFSEGLHKSTATLGNSTATFGSRPDSSDVTHPPNPTNMSQQAILKRKADQQNQSKKIAAEARATVFLASKPKCQADRASDEMCRDDIIWKIVTHLPSKLMKKAYQSGFKLVEDRQRNLIKSNKERVEELSKLENWHFAKNL